MTTPAIRIAGLTKSYADLQALAGIDLEIQPGAFFGLLGPNGAGKTTTINILAGLCNMTAGEVTVFGHDLIADYRACRRQIGLVPQEFNFDVFVRLRKMLIFQGGYFGVDRATCARRADELLAEFELTAKADVQVRQLSGGMKRRANIARALIHQPKVLILDEPTAGVDVDLRRALWSYLRRLNREGTTVLLTTHYIEEAEALCDRIAIIREGRIVTVDTARNLVARLTREQLRITAAESVSPLSLQQLAPLRPKLADDGVELVVEFDRNDLDYQQMLELVIGAGVRIVNIDPVGNKLEQVFVSLTRQHHD